VGRVLYAGRLIYKVMMFVVRLFPENAEYMQAGKYRPASAVPADSASYNAHRDRDSFDAEKDIERFERQRKIDRMMRDRDQERERGRERFDNRERYEHMDRDMDTRERGRWEHSQSPAR